MGTDKERFCVVLAAEHVDSNISVGKRLVDDDDQSARGVYDSVSPSGGEFLSGVAKFFSVFWASCCGDIVAIYDQYIWLSF